MMEKEAVASKMERAICSGNLAKVKKLMAFCNQNHWLVGHAVVYKALLLSLPEVAAFLIQSGAQIDSKHLLILAIVKSYLTIVELLLSRGARVNVKDHRGCSLLHLAVINKNLEITKLLLLNHADANATDWDGFTSLHVAARTGNVEIMKCLLDHGANVNCCAAGRYEGCTPLHFAVEYGMNNIELVRVLLDNGANCNAKSSNGQTPLHIASGKGLADTVELLLERGAEVEANDQTGRTPVSYATRFGDTGIVLALLKKGAVFKPDNLLNAICSRCPEVVDVLLKQSFEVDEKIRSKLALHRADFPFDSSDNNLVEVFRRMIRLLFRADDAELNAQLRAQCALMDAVKEESFHLIPSLLKEGATPNWNFGNGKTLLHICAEKCYDPKIAKCILKRGANVNALVDGKTPLHSAVTANNWKVVNVLLQWPLVNISARDKEGHTALFKAAVQTRPDLFQAPLFHGADTNISDNDEFTDLYKLEEEEEGFYRQERPRYLFQYLVSRHLEKNSNELVNISQNSDVSPVLKNTDECESMSPIYDHSVKSRFKRAEGERRLEGEEFVRKIKPLKTNGFLLQQFYRCRSELKLSSRI